MYHDNSLPQSWHNLSHMCMLYTVYTIIDLAIFIESYTIDKKLTIIELSTDEGVHLYLHSHMH